MKKCGGTVKCTVRAGSSMIADDNDDNDDIVDGDDEKS